MFFYEVREAFGFLNIIRFKYFYDFNLYLQLWNFNELKNWIYIKLELIFRRSIQFHDIENGFASQIYRAITD